MWRRNGKKRIELSKTTTFVKLWWIYRRIKDILPYDCIKHTKIKFNINALREKFKSIFLFHIGKWSIFFLYITCSNTKIRFHSFRFDINMFEWSMKLAILRLTISSYSVSDLLIQLLNHFVVFFPRNFKWNGWWTTPVNINESSIRFGFGRTIWWMSISNLWKNEMHSEFSLWRKILLILQTSQQNFTSLTLKLGMMTKSNKSKKKSKKISSNVWSKVDR